MVRAATSGSSRHTTRGANLATRSRNSVVVTTAETRAAAIIARSRSSGWPGSSGRYAAPAFHVASTAMGTSRMRGSARPTIASGLMPNPRSSDANCSARASSAA
jgi:hypothetical protein